MLKGKEACQRSTCVFPELGTWKTFVLYRHGSLLLHYLFLRNGEIVRPGNMLISPTFRKKRMEDQEFKANLGYMRLNPKEKKKGEGMDAKKTRQSIQEAKDNKV